MGNILKKLNDEKWAGDNRWQSIIEYETSNGEIGLYTSFGGEMVHAFLYVDNVLTKINSYPVSAAPIAIEDMDNIAKFASATKVIK